MDSHQLLSCALLMLISVTHSVGLVRIERLRLAVTSGRVPNIHSTWTFAGALLLPPLPLLALIAVVYLGDWPSRRIVMASHPGRYVYSAAAMGAASLAAGWVAGFGPYPLGVALAFATFALVNAGCVAAAIAAAGQYRVLRMFLVPANHAVELITMLAGVALAVSMQWSPVTAALAAPCLILLHRSSLREVIRNTSSYDPDTGLWAEVAWRTLGQQLLSDSGTGYVALIIIDPDQPAQEAAIVANLGAGVERRLGPKATNGNARDLVGRYGTRQVAVLMDVGPASAGRLFMARIHADLVIAGISATLGVAVTADREMDELIMDAVSDLMGRREMAGVERRW